MNVEMLHHAAAVVGKLKMYPYFDVSNYILMCMMVREDGQKEQQGGQVFSRRHPLSSWLSSMLMCFASVIITNVLVGESPIAPFTNNRDLLTASVVWYAINYAPFDLTYKLCKLLPVKIVIYCLKEVQRTHKVHHGVEYALKHFPGSYPVVCIIGVIKGAGYYYMRIFERLIRGTWIPSSHEILSPTLATKACFCASVTFILHEIHLIDIDHHLLYLAVVAFFVFLRILYLLLGVHDPFHPFENVFCGIFLGGIVDALKKAVGGEEKGKVEDNSAGKGHGHKSKDD